MDNIYDIIDVDNDSEIINALNNYVTDIDFYFILYLSLIRCISHNSNDSLKVILETYNSFITNNLKNSVIINVINNYKEINPFLIIKKLKVSVNQYLIDLILKNKLNGDKRMANQEIFIVLKFMTDKISQTPIVKMFVSKNISFSDVIKTKSDTTEINVSWKTYCNIFDKLNYRDLVLYLNTKGIIEYNNSPLSKYNQREICYFMRNNMIKL